MLCVETVRLFSRYEIMIVVVISVEVSQRLWQTDMLDLFLKYFYFVNNFVPSNLIKAQQKCIKV